MFPAGPPGVGLVLLRLSVALTMTAIMLRPGHHLSDWLAFPLALGVLGLCLGAWTPVFGTLLLAMDLSSWAIWPQQPVLRLVGALMAVALLLLGPGAYSLDARQFGRRLVSFPGDDPPAGE